MSNHPDEIYMSRCLELAKKGAGFVSPNPMVGAVIVKSGKIISEGFHRRFGAPHAEIEALKKISFRARGATLYCNLEPCFHEGKTPPCVHPVIQSGIARVVISHPDPNPLVSGKSIRLLRKSGIKVDVGVLKNEALFLNRFFVTWVSKKRPHIILKAGVSLDGKIALPKKNGGRKVSWITSPESRREVHRLRATVSAVLVGANTVKTDNPRLNVRGIKGACQPARIILDGRLRTPVDSRIFAARGGPVLIATCRPLPQRAREYQKRGAEVLGFPGTARRRTPRSLLVRNLAKRGISSILVEGGKDVFGSFFKAGLCDEIILFVAPKIIGGEGLDLFPDLDFGKKRLVFNEVAVSGADLKVWLSSIFHFKKRFLNPKKPIKTHNFLGIHR